MVPMTLPVSSAKALTSHESSSASWCPLGFHIQEALVSLVVEIVVVIGAIVLVLVVVVGVGFFDKVLGFN